MAAASSGPVAAASSAEPSWSLVVGGALTDGSLPAASPSDPPPPIASQAMNALTRATTITATAQAIEAVRRSPAGGAGEMGSLTAPASHSGTRPPASDRTPGRPPPTGTARHGAPHGILRA